MKKLSCATLLALAFVSMGASGFRQDEVLCEEAIATLAKCCPSFAASSASCSYTESCDGATYPTLTEAESNCVLAASCSDLVAKGVCVRAANAEPRTSSAASEFDGSVASLTGTSAVCP